MLNGQRGQLSPGWQKLLDRLDLEMVLRPKGDHEVEPLSPCLYSQGMKHLILMAVLLAPFAVAADPVAAVESAAPFEGAIDGISDITTIAHLPGYGLNVNARWLGDYDQDTVVDQLQSVVVGLSGLVRGLDDGDLVSVAWRGQAFMDDPVVIVVRMVPGDEATLETFIDGVIQ